MVIPVTFLFWVMTYNFLLCELGQWVTNGFDRFGDELDGCDWHLWPIELQRLYLIFLLDTQQPTYTQCFGGILCSRDTFKKVNVHKSNHLYIDWSSPSLSLFLFLAYEQRFFLFYDASPNEIKVSLLSCLDTQIPN